jgi:hypothetical protein
MAPVRGDGVDYLQLQRNRESDGQFAGGKLYLSHQRIKQRAPACRDHGREQQLQL